MTQTDCLAQDWVQRVTAACLEVLHGQRNAVHLKNVVSAKVAHSLTMRASLNRARHYPPSAIVRIRQSQPREGVYEIAATFMSGKLACPVAMRIERIATGWLVTAFEVGPH